MTDCFEKLYEKYLSECAFFPDLPHMELCEFCEFANSALSEAERIYLEDNKKGSGTLFYFLYEESGCTVCDVPLFGYFASSEKALSYLFCALSEKLVGKGDVLFRVRLYAHDTKAQRLFSMMQFGYMSEKGVFDIRALEYKANERYTVRTLSKDMIEENWKTVWDMTYGIVCQLKGAPVFYPCDEFTEEVYRDFYSDENTCLHSVYENEKPIGIIESNGESDFFCKSANAANVGEAYVIPELRGCGAADELLLYAAAYEKKRGAEYLWVEHGTANPCARGFWNKYFKTYMYEMVRKIDAEI